MEIRDKIPLAGLLARMQENWPEALSPETEAILAIIRLNDVVDEHARKIMSRFSLTPVSFEVLTTLRAMPHPRQLTPTELYRTTLITSGGMTKVLKNLEDRQLIDRIASDQDGRSRFVRLLPAGADLIEKAMTAVMEGDQDLMSRSLSEDQRNNLRTILLEALERLE